MKRIHLSLIQITVSGLLTMIVPAIAQVPPAGEQQGYSVAMDENIAVTGAPAGSGCVKVYDATTGTLLHTLANPRAPEADNFGSAVGIFGARVVVGAPYGQGTAYVYDLSSGTPTVPVATLNDPMPLAVGPERFGSSVGISGTLVVVGSPGSDVEAIDAGRVYVYDLAGATPTVPVFTLINPEALDTNLASGDAFGHSVAIFGTKIAVGAPRDGEFDAGIAYLYDLTSATPTNPVSILSNPTPRDNNMFGWSVAVAETRALVGAPFEDFGGTDAGTVYMYGITLPIAVMPPKIILNNPAPEHDDNFGYSVAIAEPGIVVGAPHDHSGTSYSGRAFIFNVGDLFTPTVPVARLAKVSPMENDAFGYSVAMSSTRVLIGAPGDDTRAIDAGSAHLYSYSLDRSVPPVLLATLNSSCAE
jgi:hypothetical protein